jgi:hypothetical protein
MSWMEADSWLESAFFFLVIHCDSPCTRANPSNSADQQRLNGFPRPHAESLPKGQQIEGQDYRFITLSPSRAVSLWGSGETPGAKTLKSVPSPDLS